jgi:hypothetical protein
VGLFAANKMSYFDGGINDLRHNFLLLLHILLTK